MEDKQKEFGFIKDLPKVPEKTLRLAELCVALDVTPSWIGKAVRTFPDLTIGEGRGIEVEYTEEMTGFFRVVVLLRALGISWDQLTELRKQYAKGFSWKELPKSILTKVDRRIEQYKLLQKQTKAA